MLSRLHNGTNYEGRLVFSMWYIYKTCGKFSNYEIHKKNANENAGKIRHIYQKNHANH